MAHTPRSARRSKGDQTRRARWLDSVHESGISRGAVAWAVCLVRRSNATAKPVWGAQTGQATEIHCSDRQVRRYRAELEKAGLIEVKRGKPERRHGRFGRGFTNIYSFVVAPLVRKRKTSSHRPDTDVRSNPSLTGDIQTFLDPIQNIPRLATPVLLEGVAACRAALGRRRNPVELVAP